jgi:hypothetical protein
MASRLGKMDDNVVDITNKSYVCPNCKGKNITCTICNSILKDDNFYSWLILNRLIGKPRVAIRYSDNNSGKAIRLIDLFKISVGLVERKKRIIVIEATKLEMHCQCGNILKFIQEDDKIREFVCMRCKNKAFTIKSKEKIKIEKYEVVLEKLPAVIAATEIE